MNSLTTTRIEFFVAPSEVQIVDYDERFIQTIEPEDTFLQTVIVSLDGRELKILRYDEDDNSVFVCEGQEVKQMRSKDVLDYLRNL